MTLKQLLNRRKKLKEKWQEPEKKQRQIEEETAEVNIQIQKLCTDHDWVWSIMHRRVDKCHICYKTRLIENRPDDYKLTLRSK